MIDSGWLHRKLKIKASNHYWVKWADNCYTFFWTVRLIFSNLSSFKMKCFTFKCCQDLYTNTARENHKNGHKDILRGHQLLHLAVTHNLLREKISMGSIGPLLSLNWILNDWWCTIYGSNIRQIIAFHIL